MAVRQAVPESITQPPLLAVAAAITLAHLGVALLEPTLTELLLFEGVVVGGLVVMELWLTGETTQAVSLGLVLVAFLGSGWLLLWQSSSLWQVTLALMTALAGLGYGVHRYQLYRLGQLT